jgi:hypothetical protein
MLTINLAKKQPLFNQALRQLLNIVKAKPEKKEIKDQKKTLSPFISPEYKYEPGENQQRIRIKEEKGLILW